MGERRDLEVFERGLLVCDLRFAMRGVPRGEDRGKRGSLNSKFSGGGVGFGDKSLDERVMWGRL